MGQPSEPLVWEWIVSMLLTKYRVRAYVEADFPRARIARLCHNTYTRLRPLFVYFYGTKCNARDSCYLMYYRACKSKNEVISNR